SVEPSNDAGEATAAAAAQQQLEDETTVSIDGLPILIEDAEPQTVLATPRFLGTPSTDSGTLPALTADVSARLVAMEEQLKLVTLQVKLKKAKLELANAGGTPPAYKSYK
ncbi:hypothetical protein EG327_002094, partial [Venturia inaequalis]